MFHEYTAFMNDDDIPMLPGYVSIKEAAKKLGISERRVYLYVETKRLAAVRAADVLLIPLEALNSFKRNIAGRPRKSTPTWRISSEENTQFMTSIIVQIRPGQREHLGQRLEEIRQSGKQTFPGTIARYIAGSDTLPNQIEIVLIWRSTVMPDEATRKQALQALQQALTDILDWKTARYNHGTIFMHT